MMARIMKYGMMVLLLAAAGIALIYAVMGDRVESRLFQRYILRPVPISVGDIKVDRPSWGHRGRKVVFHFRISRADVLLICKSAPFRKFDWATCHFGNLFWGNLRDEQSDPRLNPFAGVNVADIVLYRDGYPQPEWFVPNDWTNAQVYVSRERWEKTDWVHTKILIYNEESNEAYFVDDLGDYGGRAD
jgi:hypothetical protein